MKTKLLSLFSACCMISTVSVAQITIDSTDMPSIGDTAVMGVDTTAPAGLLVGGTGGPQAWDFTAIQIDVFDTLIYIDPASTAYSADFPSSNLAIAGATNVFQTLDTNALITDGQAGADPFGAGLTVSANFDPTQVVVTLPSTDGSMFSDTSGFDQRIETTSLGLPVPNVDSIRLVHKSWATSIFDAYGDVTTATGTFPSIRQFYTEKTEDSIFAYCSDPAGCNVFIATLPFGWSFVPSQLTQLIVGVDNPRVDTTYKYKWWANGEDVPVAEVETYLPGGQALSAKYKLGNNVIAIAGGSTDALCNGSCDGTATVTGLGGSGVFTYVWDDPAAQSTATATGLCAGTYGAYIVDGPDTSGTVSFTVGQPTALGVIFTTTVSPGDTTGIATALVTGGKNPYFYLWSTVPPQTTASAINLVPGIYGLTITDANGCTLTDSVEILPALDVAVSGAGETQALCDGTAAATASGGTPPYTYAWDDPSSQTTATAVNLCGGDYTVTVTDGAGGTISSTVTVDAFVGIGEPGGNLTASVYPNPAADVLFVDAGNGQGATFAVYNLIGEQVINERITGQRNAINTKTLANGVYVFRLLDDAGALLRSDRFAVVH